MANFAKAQLLKYGWTEGTILKDLINKQQISYFMHLINST